MNDERPKRCPDCDLLWTRLRNGAWACAGCGQTRHDTPEIIAKIMASFRPDPVEDKPKPVAKKPKPVPQMEELF